MGLTESYNRVQLEPSEDMISPSTSSGTVCWFDLGWNRSRSCWPVCSPNAAKQGSDESIHKSQT